MKEFLSGWIQKIENLPPLYGCILVYRSNVLRVPDQFLREGVEEIQILVAKLVVTLKGYPCGLINSTDVTLTVGAEFERMYIAKVQVY